MALPIQEILTGLSLGSRYFLVAIGLSLIFGVLGVLNFAHGALYMIGAYVSLTVVQNATGNFWVGLIAAGLAVGAVGAIIEMGLIRRVYDRDELDQLILTFALVLIISDLTRTVWGSGNQTMATPELLASNVQFLGTSYPAYRLFVIVVGFAAMGVFWYAIQRTYLGRLVRATSSDRDMAALLGVNVPRLYTGVFFAGSFLAGIGGALAAPMQAFTPALGDQVIINAFIIVVIGGLGSFTGAFVGAMFIGLLQSFGVLVASGVGQLLPFLAMILVLIFRPEGLFGGEEQ
ncbi:branched-chain amino acid ABC transporter permease [Salarchaeum sp. JOR-1]|uniref:branched-chain amino acid ABC transporter permease n=1 Tax=Salarchaeum sp. JOR-1 TaxID=2599399 RepID=UPI0011988E89|nr:branched-chain amino acid ABC transporter permease [Salarchaeum sp. JOR-1]QDX40953.1 branched-chain amino acid ABC transporter permease [Salarchaeum sp. JOR-1]